MGSFSFKLLVYVLKIISDFLHKEIKHFEGCDNPPLLFIPNNVEDQLPFVSIHAAEQCLQFIMRLIF